MATRKTKVQFFKWSEDVFGRSTDLQKEINAFLASDECDEVIDIKSGSFVTGGGKFPGAHSSANHGELKIGGNHFIIVHYYPPEK